VLAHSSERASEQKSSSHETQIHSFLLSELTLKIYPRLISIHFTNAAGFAQTRGGKFLTSAWLALSKMASEKWQMEKLSFFLSPFFSESN
jgi:hypothetical protein